MFYQNILNPLLFNIKNKPDNNAFLINKEYYTYGEFGLVISSISEVLSNREVTNKNIGLVINDDIETYASIFALWLNGYCYVPLHPQWPLERCLDICEQVDIKLILDSSETTRYDKDIVVNTKNINVAKDYIIEPQNDVCENDLAYILFTSGSTGKPKGVQISRKNIASFTDSFWKTGIQINENDRCLQVFDLTFDVSVQSYLVPLCKGACCYTIPYGQIKYIYACGLIEDYHITFAAMAPSMLRYLQRYFGEFDSSSLKNVILTAEACPLSLIENFYEYAKNVDIYDFYGPTEGTIYCTYYKLTRGGTNKTINGIVSIGKPLANVIALIVDEKGNEVPVGTNGELCIAGNQVTCGYFKNPEKNFESFFTKEIRGKQICFYHTGDLCHKDEEGDIMYIGRIDHQAKIQGFRVEMGEIEWHANEFLKSKNVVCIPYNKSDGLTEIAMFIESKPFDDTKLMEHLRNKMPVYMIPSKRIFVPVFPLNANDKIDKVQLKAML